MKYSIGRYYKFENSLWSISESDFITITKVDLENQTIFYFYDTDGIIRVRNFEDFSRIGLIPTSSLLEELI